jgi:hypothetical protein
MVSSRFIAACSALITLTSGCVRATAASFVPQLQLSLQARRVAVVSLLDANAHEHGRWATTALVALSFTPVRPASQLPTYSELSTLDALSPCAEDDVVCLQETAESESELANVAADQP